MKHQKFQTMLASDFQVYKTKLGKMFAKLKMSMMKRVTGLENRLADTTAELDKAHRELDEHKLGSQHRTSSQPHATQQLTPSLRPLNKKIEEMKHRIAIQELNDEGMDNAVTDLENKLGTMTVELKKQAAVNKV